MIQAVLWQRVEGLCVFIAGMVLFYYWNDALPWWGALVIFFFPDLSFFFYFLGPKIGAFCYNAVHVYAFGAIVLAIGVVTPAPFLAILGPLWLAHSGFDRMLGYGLKSQEGFYLTHLGRIGKSA